MNSIKSVANKGLFVSKLCKFKVEKTFNTVFTRLLLKAYLFLYDLLGRKQFKSEPYERRQNSSNIRNIHILCLSVDEQYYKKPYVE